MVQANLGTLNKVLDARNFVQACLTHDGESNRYVTSHQDKQDYCEELGDVLT